MDVCLESCVPCLPKLTTRVWMIAAALAAIGVLCTLAASPVNAAATGGNGTLTDVANAFKATSGSWITTALAYARHLFVLLVALELAWTGVTYVLQRDSLPDFVANLVLKLMGVFFFLAVIQNAPTWIPAIVGSFSQAGSAISGQSVVLDPSATFGEGLQLAKTMLATLNNPAFLTAVLAILLAVLCSIAVVVAFAVVAGQLMVTLIESYIVISAGLFFLGFSGSRWTLPFSERYVGYAISVGIKLFMLYLIVGLGETLAHDWLPLFKAGSPSPPEVYIGVAGSALVFMLLGWQIPSMAASLMNGSPSMSLGGLANTASTMVAAGAAVGGAGLAVSGAVTAASVSAATMAAARLNPSSRSGAHEPAPVGFISGPPDGVGSRPSSDSQPSSGPVADTAPAPQPHPNSTIGDQSETTTQGSSLGGAIGPEPATSVGGSHIPGDGGVGASSDARSPVEDNLAVLRAIAETAREAASAQVPSPASRIASVTRKASAALRNVQLPSAPSDAAGGAIHIRFRHHDGD